MRVYVVFRLWPVPTARGWESNRTVRELTRVCSSQDAAVRFTVVYRNTFRHENPELEIAEYFVDGDDDENIPQTQDAPTHDGEAHTVVLFRGVRSNKAG